jgi:hypothetical protein
MDWFALGTYCRLFAYFGLNPTTGEPLEDVLKAKMDRLESDAVQTVGEYVAHKLSETTRYNAPPPLGRPVRHPRYSTSLIIIRPRRTYVRQTFPKACAQTCVTFWGLWLNIPLHFFTL